MTMKKLQTIKKPLYSLLILIGCSLLVAICSHAFFIKEWYAGTFMTGPGDGLSQMLPFKQLLYEQYKQGNFFYSNTFGMGGGIYSQLSYYFSTSVFFIGTAIITFLLEKMGIIEEPNIFYWANMIIPISIIRLTITLLITFRYFSYMNIRKIPAFVGAVLYGTSVIYFRHVTYWEFFADAMVWLPLVLYGIEKVIKEKKLSTFIVALSICVFDNFYFSYITILVASIYIIGRWVFVLEDDEAGIMQQFKLYLIGGITAFGIGAISFIPAVYGYLNNHRISYEGYIPLFGAADNPLLDGRIIVIPTIAILALFLGFLYRNKYFAFFTALSIFSFLIHFSPLVASVFNGFSAPQYRWEYFFALILAGVVATSLNQLHLMKKKQMIIALIGTIALYLIAYFIDPFLPFDGWQAAYLLYGAIVTMLIFTIVRRKPMLITKHVLAVFIILVSLYTSNFYQYVKLYETGNVKQSTVNWMKSDAYMGRDQLSLLEEIEQNDTSFYRIDWMTPTRNNTPMVQNFHGLSVYSSILNNHLLYFYLYHLEIDMGRESVSRYGTVGNRSNLASLLAGKYYMTTREDPNIPYGFSPKYTQGKYIVYENEHVLPFIRTTSNVYMEEQLENEPPIVRERAMLDGVVLATTDKVMTKLQLPSENKQSYTLQTEEATYSGNTLTVFENDGGIRLTMKEKHQGDYYVSFQLTRKDQNKGFTLHVNEYETVRKSNTSIYKTGVDQLTIRIKSANEIMIRLPKGEYELRDIHVYGEDYHLLEHKSSEQKAIADTPFTWKKNKVTFTLHNQKNDRFLILPIPYEKGWVAYINGEKQQVERVNYAFIGLKLMPGMNEIQFIYYPPYFFLSMIISVVTILCCILFRLIRRKLIFKAL